MNEQSAHANEPAGGGGNVGVWLQRIIIGLLILAFAWSFLIAALVALDR